MKGKILTAGVLTCLAVSTALAENDDANIRNMAGYLATSSVNQAMQNENAQDWMKRTTVNVSFQKNFTPQYEVETVQPLTKVDADTKQVVFAQGRVANNSVIGTTLNVGVGYRHMNSDKTAMWGVNGFYDHGFKYNHSRISGGLEYFHGQHELHLNAYSGVSGEKEVDTTNHIFQRVADGYDVEYAHTFKNAEWAKVYANTYRWDMKHSEDAKGFFLGADLQLTPQISLDLGYNKVNGMSGTPYGKIMYRLGNAPVALWGGKHSFDTKTTVEGKLLSKVRRNNNIVVETYGKQASKTKTIDYSIRVD